MMMNDSGSSDRKTVTSEAVTSEGVAEAGNAADDADVPGKGATVSDDSSDSQMGLNNDIKGSSAVIDGSSNALDGSSNALDGSDKEIECQNDQIEPNRTVVNCAADDVECANTDVTMEARDVVPVAIVSKEVESVTMVSNQDNSKNVASHENGFCDVFMECRQSASDEEIFENAKCEDMIVVTSFKSEFETYVIKLDQPRQISQSSTSQGSSLMNHKQDVGQSDQDVGHIDHDVSQNHQNVSKNGSISVVGSSSQEISMESITETSVTREVFYVDVNDVHDIKMDAVNADVEGIMTTDVDADDSPSISLYGPEKSVDESEEVIKKDEGYEVKLSNTNDNTKDNTTQDEDEAQLGTFVRQTSFRQKRSSGSRRPVRKTKLEVIKETKSGEDKTDVNTDAGRNIHNNQGVVTSGNAVNTMRLVMGSQRLGSLVKDHHGNKAEKKEKEEKENSQNVGLDFNNQLIQRCVVIQRDEKGYGLTVSGDNPVFVQSVKENGAAARAGVQKGDRIIKVNGTLVTNSNHVEVVNLIKSGSYVALTLLGRTPGKSPPVGDNITHPSNERVSAPRSVNAEMDQEYKTQKVATIRMMYEKAANDYEKMKMELARNPQASHLQMQLTDVGRMLKTLEQQLFELTGIPAESQQLSPGSSSRPVMVGGLPHHPPPPHPGLLRRYGSGDHLQLINRESMEMETVPEQSSPINPAPWLAGGPKHRKADSMPEYFSGTDEGPGSKEVTVVRSHSDSRKRTSQQTLSVAEMKEGVSAEEIEKLRGDIIVRRRKTMKKTTSLPSKMSEAGMTSELSPHGSPATSPSPEGTANDDSHMGEPPLLGADTPTSARSVPPMNLTTPDNQLPFYVVSPQQVDVIPMEDEFDSEGEHVDEPGPFGDLNVLKHKPAHVTVFLHYLISNSDPSPFFFYLVTENYPSGNTKEMRKWAYEIHSTFLVNTAPLRLNMDDEIVSSIDKTLLHKSDKEDALRMIFQNARHVAQGVISELLADFRIKQSLGLGNLYGAHLLQNENMSKAAELALIEKYLLPHLETFLKEENISDRNQTDRNQAMASALATFLKNLGHQFSGKNAALLERCPSFTSKDKKAFRFGKKQQKIHVVKNHSFGAQHYYSVTNCHYCQNVVWGIGNQGYQCINCDYNVHKQCMDSVKETCIGRKTKDRHRKSLMDKIIIRKPSQNSAVAIPPYVTAVREAQKNLEEAQSGNVTSPGASTPTSVFHIKRDDDDEDLDTSRKSSREDRNSDMVRSPDENRNSTSTIQSPDATGDTDDQKKAGSNLTRSESLNKKPELKKNVRRTKSDLHVDEHTLKALNQSGSSSNSSISGSFESPTNSHEVLSNDSTLNQSVVLDNDPELYTLETELPRLEDIIPADNLKRLKPKEKKRQEVINELLYTERSHVRNLKVMQKVFHIRMRQTEWISQDLTKLLFPNLGDMIELHESLNSGFKAKRKENPVVGDIADILLDRFLGENGDNFKRTCAIFCQNQSYALDVLRSRMRKDAKLANFLQELSADPLCRRLELKDLLPSGMQRLTKYPLLIESLMKYTPSNSEEYEKLQRSSKLSRGILDHVNKAVSESEDRQKLVELQRRLDRRPIENINHPVTSEYKTLDLTRHKLIHDGPLTWRIGQKKLIDLHVVLLEDILVLLQKQDEKLVLKCQSTTVVAGKEDTKFTHSPIIKLTNLLTRNVATDRRAFFLVSTSHLGPQIYELVASTIDDKNKWIKHIGDATESYKVKDTSKVRRSGTTGRPPPAPREEDSEGETANRKESREESQALMRNVIEEEEPSESGPDANQTLDSALERNQSASVDSLEHMKVIEVQQINHSELIQPNEVIVMDTPFEHAQPVLTPMEKLRRRDEMIREALDEKRKIVSEILQVPEGEFENIADMAGEVEGEKEGRELVLAAISQTNKLSDLLNSALRLTEEPQTTCSEGGATAAGPSWDAASHHLLVSLPSSKINHIASHLNKCLGELLDVVTSRDEERDRLQHKLKMAQEQLAILHHDVSPSHSQTSRPNSFASVASSTASDPAEDLPDGLTNIPVVNLTQQSAAYEMEQFSAVPQSAAKETTTEGEKRDSVMLSSVSSDGQEVEEGLHDARTDHELNQESNQQNKDSQNDSPDNDTSESTVGESDSN